MPANQRNQLRRLSVFVWLIVVVGLVQAVGAAFAAVNVDDPAAAGVQFAVAVGVALVGASTVAARIRFTRRPWRTDAADALIVDFSTRVVVQVILALGAANVAFAGAILTGAPWMVVVGLVFFLPPMAVVVPTKQNLARVQTELDAQGCRLDLVECLRPTDSV
jgi:hypothetical protein